MLDVHDLTGMEQLRRELRLDPHRLRRLRLAFYKQHRGSEQALAELPEDTRTRARDKIRFHHLELVEARDSTADGASKLIFRTHDSLLIETVILRVNTGRTALCVSSQVGCGAGCTFCATGMGGVRRSLTAAEILDQIVQANELLASERSTAVRNIVFMGMGEPFHNEAAVHRALEVLDHPECFHHSPRRVSVSTVGIPDAMVACARRFPKVRLALSLHSARDEVRRSIIPLARRYSLDALRVAVAEVARVQSQRVMLEYVLLRGINDGAWDLAALIDWADGLLVHINLIPFNLIAEAPELHATQKPTRDAFADELKARGFRVTQRYSLGADVTAACGQLARMENGGSQP